ncbi:hypothetical protein [Peribacillus sp. V2I11]|uniref:hypothetical protein n=1 Tax=Peribacillus sp. V2I11 TaxID=3042277 RepID=UPI00277DE337|nr:hypothetical protein [Peribacillus sp. V2I11]MDQ0881786.1 hypothetical protein [Peribacillus sp. V2I11]
MSDQAKSSYMSFGMEPITGRMNAGALTGMTSRSWSGIRGDVNANGTRFAENVFELPYKLSDIRLKHLCWLKEEDRMAKFKRYRKLEPGGKYGSTEHI